MDSFTTNAPHLVDPIGPGGIVGFTLLAVLGMAVLVGFALAYDDTAHPAMWVGTGVGALAIGFAAHRFFRAVAPSDHMANALLWAAFLGVSTLVAALLWRVLRIRASAWFSVLAGGTAATGIAAAIDRANESLSRVPLSWAGLITLVVLAGAALWALAHGNR